MNEKELQIIKQKALDEHIPIIIDDTLEVIAKILKEIKPKRILEIGTAVGYSAMCFSKFLAEDRNNRYNRKRRNKSKRGQGEY